MSGAINNTVNVYNQSAPQGCLIKGVPIQCVIGGGIPFEIDLTLQQQQGKIDQIQSAWVDNSNGSGDVSINCGPSQQVVKIPRGYQGFVPLTVTNPPVFILVCAVNSSFFIELMNVPMPVGIWSATGIPGGSNYSGVSSVSVSVATTRTLLLPANSSRKFLLIAPNAAIFFSLAGDPGIDPTTNPAGWLELNAGGTTLAQYESGVVAPTGEIWYYDAAGGNAITVYEG